MHNDLNHDYNYRC